MLHFSIWLLKDTRASFIWISPIFNYVSGISVLEPVNSTAIAFARYHKLARPAFDFQLVGPLRFYQQLQFVSDPFTNKERSPTEGRQQSRHEVKLPVNTNSILQMKGAGAPATSAPDLQFGPRTPPPTACLTLHFGDRFEAPRPFIYTAIWVRRLHYANRTKRIGRNNINHRIFFIVDSACPHSQENHL